MQQVAKIVYASLIGAYLILMLGNKHLSLQFWSCSDAPAEMRRLVPGGFEEGWIARLPKELFQDKAIKAIFEEKQRWITHVICLADGGGLIIGRSKDAVPAFVWLSEQIETRRLK